MELTFNLNEVFENDMHILDVQKLLEYKKKRPAPVTRPSEIEKFLVSNFSITTTELREFIEKTFGIELTGIDCSSNRNRLNELVKMVAPTTRGKRTSLNFFQFKELLLLEGFSRFILKNHNESKVVNKEKMYQEIMYLQMNKYKDTIIYKKDRLKEAKVYGAIFALIPNVASQIREYYCKWAEIYFLHQDLLYSSIPAQESLQMFLKFNKLIDEADECTKQIFTIVGYRFDDWEGQRYQFTSIEDVLTTTDDQIMEFFFKDFLLWLDE